MLRPLLRVPAVRHQRVRDRLDLAGNIAPVSGHALVQPFGGFPAQPLTGFPFTYVTSPGGNRAWDNLWANREGLQDRFAAASHQPNVMATM